VRPTFRLLMILPLLTLVWGEMTSANSLSDPASDSKGNTGVEPTNIDFNNDGAVDADDLISFLHHRGTVKGMGNYRVLYDFNQDDRIDHDDLIILMDAWKEQVTPVPPVTIGELLTLTGFDHLEQNTWRFECLDGADPDCTGEDRTIARGDEIEIDGKMAVPIIWGSATGEPLETLYLSMDAWPFSVLRIEKNADASRISFPGINVLPLTIESSGTPIGATSEMVEFGKEVAVSGTGSIQTTLKLGAPMSEVDYSCRQTPYALAGIAAGVIGIPGDKGELEPPPPEMLLFIGDGTVDHAMGQHRTSYEIVCNATGIEFINFSWQPNGSKFSRSYDRIPDPSPTPTPSTSPISTVAETPTVTETPTAIVTVTPTVTDTPINTLTDTPTVTQTAVDTITETPTTTETGTPTATATVTPIGNCHDESADNTTQASAFAVNPPDCVNGVIDHPDKGESWFTFTPPEDGVFHVISEVTPEGGSFDGALEIRSSDSVAPPIASRNLLSPTTFFPLTARIKGGEPTYVRFTNDGSISNDGSAETKTLYRFAPDNCPVEEEAGGITTNDTPETAEDITSATCIAGSINAMSDPIDWFKYTEPTGGVRRFLLPVRSATSTEVIIAGVFDETGAGVSCAVIDPVNISVLVVNALANTQYDMDIVTAPDSLEPFVHLDYVVRVLEPMTCSPETEENDSPGSAALITTSTCIEADIGVGVGDTVDYYRVRASNSGTLRIVVIGGHVDDTGTATVSYLDSQLRPIEQSALNDRGATSFDFGALAGEEFVVKIEQILGPLSYELRVEQP